jgi:hypothetical protein
VAPEVVGQKAVAATEAAKAAAAKAVGAREAEETGSAPHRTGWPACPRRCELFNKLQPGAFTSGGLFRLCC